MGIELRLREILTLEDPGGGFTDGVMSRLGVALTVTSGAGVALLADARARRRSRRTLFGILLAVAVAAAAMLASISGSDVDGPVSLQAAATSPADDSSAPATASAISALPDESPPAETVLTLGSYTVRVPAVEIEGNDVVGSASATRLRDTVIEKLLKVPDLLLIDPVSGRAAFDVRFKFSGGGSLAKSVRVEAGIPAALDEMARLAAGDTADRMEAQLRRVRNTSDRVTGFAAPPAAGLLTEASLSDIDASADQLVFKLRVQVFPLSDALERDLLARLTDPAATGRTNALSDLLTIAERRGGLSYVAAATVRAGAQLALTAPQAINRQMVWDLLLATRHPDLAAYLVQGLDAEPDPDLKLWIINTLASDFGEDPQARAALAAAVQRESQPAVRVAAAQALQTDTTPDAMHRSEQVAAAINDASLSDVQRLQMVAQVAMPASGEANAGLQLDDDTIRDLGAVLIRTAPDPAATHAAKRCLSVLAATSSSVARDVVIDILRLPSEENQGTAKMSIRGLRLAAVGLGSSHYPDDDKVAAVIAEIADGPDQFIRPMARMELSLMDMKSRKDAFRQGERPK